MTPPPVWKRQSRIFSPLLILVSVWRCTGSTLCATQTPVDIMEIRITVFLPTGTTSLMLSTTICPLISSPGSNWREIFSTPLRPTRKSPQATIVFSRPHTRAEFRPRNISPSTLRTGFGTSPMSGWVQQWVVPSVMTISMIPTPPETFTRWGPFLLISTKLNISGLEPIICQRGAPLKSMSTRSASACASRSSRPNCLLNRLPLGRSRKASRRNWPC